MGLRQGGERKKERHMCRIVEGVVDFVKAP